MQRLAAGKRSRREGGAVECIYRLCRGARLGQLERRWYHVGWISGIGNTVAAKNVSRLHERALLEGVSVAPGRQVRAAVMALEHVAAW